MLKMEFLIGPDKMLYIITGEMLEGELAQNLNSLNCCMERNNTSRSKALIRIKLRKVEHR